MAKSDRKALLAEHFLLGHLPDADLDRLCDHIYEKSFEANQPVFMKGDPASSMMAVSSGRVRISSVSEQGKEVVLNMIGPGEIFGEIALLDGGERTADAVTSEPTELLILDRRDFIPLLENNAQLCIELLIVICSRLRHTSEQVEDMTFLDLRSRLAKRLVALAEESGTNIINLAQRELGEMVGVTREAVNKHLRNWESDGLISLGRESLTILDVDGLEDIASSL